MLEYDELRLRLEGFHDELVDLKDAIKYDPTQMEISKLEYKTAEIGFWDDPEKSQVIVQKLGALKNMVENFDRLKQNYEDTLVLIQMADEEQDLSMRDDITASIDDFEKDLSAQRLQTLLIGEYDVNNAILTFHAGAGGTEAQDWNQMLVRLYTRWGERHNCKVSLLDFLDGDEAGLKSATLRVEGTNAYGYLKSEHGVHRLVRISPFDASGRRHTSFASIEVMPEISDDVEIDIREEDLKIDTYRSSGAGGQHINKTSSAVRITHLPTGVVVACQTERSQFQNKDTCMRMLRSKLVEIKEREHLDKIEDIKGVQKEIAWGSQIRSYVFMPYTLAKDHRTGFEYANIGAVMDGDIDGFINAYLKASAAGQIKKENG